MLALEKAQPAASTHSRPETRVAVVLNAHARGVTDKVIHQVSAAVGKDVCFVCRTLDQLDAVARWILSRQFDVVLCGGGDGTFTRCVSAIYANAPSPAPAFGLLRLGNGNGLANTLGTGVFTSDTLPRALAHARRSEAQAPLPVLRVADRLSPFAGVGADALILEDFNRLCRSRLGFFGRGAVGYFVALATRSLWRLLLQPRPHLTIRNDGEPVWRVDPLGRPFGRPIPRGDVIYRGPAALAAASTIPHYGFGFRLFPQARTLASRGRFQLRVMDTGIIAPLLQLPELYRGSLAHERIFDFACTAVSIAARRPAPFQVGGDEAGPLERVRIELDCVRAVWGSVQEPNSVSSSRR